MVPLDQICSGKELKTGPNTTCHDGNRYVDQRTRGGLGIINTRIMFDCLLVKWIWKISQGLDEVWYKLLKAKYMTKGGVSSPNQKVLLSFGKGYTRSNICSSGEPNSKSEMESRCPSGRTVG